MPRNLSTILSKIIVLVKRVAVGFIVPSSARVHSREFRETESSPKLQGWKFHASSLSTPFGPTSKGKILVVPRYI
ncbi:uncharacterized protein RAG0_05889 [Rhynchosporium agropyri]|uniref:Uncharacterized protein n=1 Tax=Rhynchosporium agropyri TaxID=914238 RepID=A0A1E1KF32_9HELO|nr:uncharacterized protein RAG0_05889 [Rhynchosporium agropyri]